MKIYVHKKSYQNVHNSLFHNNQISVNTGMDKQIMIRVFNGIQLSNKEE